MDSRRKVIIRFFSVLALFFYAVSWSVSQFGDLIWYLGIGLPWLSLIVGIVLRLISTFLFKTFDIFDRYGWGYMYSGCTIVYIIVTSIITKTLFPFMPHLAACACFVASFYIDNLYKESDSRENKIKESVEFLESKLESIDRIILQINDSKNKELTDRLTDLLITQLSQSFRTLSKMNDSK